MIAIKFYTSELAPALLDLTKKICNFPIKCNVKCVSFLPSLAALSGTQQCYDLEIPVLDPTCHKKFVRLINSETRSFRCVCVFFSRAVKSCGGSAQSARPNLARPQGPTRPVQSAGQRKRPRGITVRF